MRTCISSDAAHAPEPAGSLTPSSFAECQYEVQARWKQAVCEKLRNGFEVAYGNRSVFLCGDVLTGGICSTEVVSQRTAGWSAHNSHCLAGWLRAQGGIGVACSPNWSQMIITVATRAGVVPL